MRRSDSHVPGDPQSSIAVVTASQTPTQTSKLLLTIRNQNTTGIVVLDTSQSWERPFLKHWCFHADMRSREITTAKNGPITNSSHLPSIQPSESITV